jgi:magnesium transporter
MKTTLIQRVVAPSPSVLSFLRAQVHNVFASPIAQCAYTTRHCRGYGIGSQIRASPGGCSFGRVTSHLQKGESSGSRRFVTSKCLTEHKGSHSPLDRSLALRHAPQTPLHHADYSTHRAFSTTRANNGWNIFNTAKMRKLAQLQPPPPPPDDTSGSSGFGSSLGRIMRPTNELKMRCTELDEHGNVTLVSGEFKKSELIAKVRKATGM